MQLKTRTFSSAAILTLLALLSFFRIEAQSPYKLNWTKDGIIIGSGIGIGVVSIIADNRVKPLTPDEINNLNKNDINGFDRFAANNYSKDIINISNVALGAAIVSPALFVFSEKMRKDWFTVGVMYGESMMISGFLTYLAKGTAKRIRPYVYNPSVQMSDKESADARMSFFSGHTSAAFTSAVFLSTVYGDYFPDSKYTPYVWGTSLLFATGIGVMRVASGEHFPTDVITGALIGSASGYLIPYLHRAKKNDGISLNYGMNLIMFNYTYRF